MWFDNPLSTSAKFQYPRNFVGDEYKWKGAKTWRHVAFSLDSASDQASLFMDGRLAWLGDWGSAVAEGDCGGELGRKIAFGHSIPGWNYGAEVEVYDFRWYVHGAGAHLSANELLALAGSQATPGISDVSFKCVQSRDTVLDSKWRDVYGHGCEWYAARKQRFPSVCASGTVQQACALTCGQYQLCFPGINPQMATPRFVWDRIRRIESKTSNGTLCLADELDRAAVVQRCRAFFRNGRDPSTLSENDGQIMQRWASMYVDLNTRKLNVSDCDTLAAAVNDYCSFKMEAVQAFTTDMKKSGGDFTLAFWIRPLVDTATSLHTDGKFYPSLTLYSGLDPPQHHLTWGLWFNPDGESRLFSSCTHNSSTRRQFENIEMVGQPLNGGASSQAWTFVAITRRNSSSPSVTSVFTNLGYFVEESHFPMCLFNESSFLSAIEVPVCVSLCVVGGGQDAHLHIRSQMYTRTHVRCMPHHA